MTTQPDKAEQHSSQSHRRPDAFTWPPVVQNIHDLFDRHIRYYPALAAAFDGDAIPAIVLSELLFQDADRMNRRAETFVMTDGRLAERTGLGLDQAQRARDLICAQGVGLFQKSVRGVPPRSNYKADYVRLYDWLIQRLSAAGLTSVTRLIPALQNMQAAQQNGEPNLGETGKLICRKPLNQFAEKPENNQEELKKKNKYTVPPRTKTSETKIFANADLGGGGGNQMSLDLMLSEPEQTLVNVLNELGMRTTKTTIGIALRFAASGIEINKLSERIRAEHAEISTANVGDVIAVLVTRLRYADPAKWLAAPKAIKGTGSRRGGMRYRQVDYTDEQREEARHRASEKLARQTPEEKIGMLQTRIEMAQRELARNPNDPDVLGFLDRAQKELAASQPMQAKTVEITQS